MNTRTLSDSEIIRKLSNKVQQLRHRLIEAQARNYDLRYLGQPEPMTQDLKARIDWLESEVRRLSRERDKNVL
jgi:hypothetical protein